MQHWDYLNHLYVKIEQVIIKKKVRERRKKKRTAKQLCNKFQCFTMLPACLFSPLIPFQCSLYYECKYFCRTICIGQIFLTIFIYISIVYVTLFYQNFVFGLFRNVCTDFKEFLLFSLHKFNHFQFFSINIIQTDFFSRHLYLFLFKEIAENGIASVCCLIFRV